MTTQIVGQEGRTTCSSEAGSEVGKSGGASEAEGRKEIIAKDSYTLIKAH